MNTISKVLIPNKEWIIKNSDTKIGSIFKRKKGYDFLRKGRKFEFKNIEDIKNELGITVLDSGSSLQSAAADLLDYSIYGYPCSYKAYNPIYNIKRKLPLFAKSAKSKSQYCAGYYIIKFRKGWTKAFCPKLITIDRYPSLGPFKTELEMKNMLNTVNKP
jgi:hypothetical protein